MVPSESVWWTEWVSNPRPPQCECGALPTELSALSSTHSGCPSLAGIDLRLGRPTDRHSECWGGLGVVDRGRRGKFPQGPRRPDGHAGIAHVRYGKPHGVGGTRTRTHQGAGRRLARGADSLTGVSLSQPTQFAGAEARCPRLRAVWDRSLVVPSKSRESPVLPISQWLSRVPTAPLSVLASSSHGRRRIRPTSGSRP